MLDTADKEILKLPRTVIGAVYEFHHKFRRNPHSPGLRLKPLKNAKAGDSRLYSARVTADYRALLLHLGGNDYLLLSVKHRKEAYDHLDRITYGINPVTGGIEFIDLHVVEENISDRTQETTRQGTEEPARPVPLFAAYTADQLRELGVAEPLLPLIAKITTEEELLGLVEYAPRLTGEVLLALYDGKSFDEVLDQITRPVSVDEQVDPEDYQAAVARPATQVTTDDQDIQKVLEDDFSRWQVFLHPTQKKIVERDYSGPARVSGGPGTGKTIVAIHRVKHLVSRLGPGHDTPVLLTTFNKNLAADLRARLLALVGPDLAARVDVVHIDKLAHRVVAEAEHGSARTVISDNDAVREWRDMLRELGETTWDAEFLAAEWSQVILGQAINSRTEYFRARRAGRGRALSRAERNEIWQLVERFTKRLDEKNVWTHQQVAERAARLEMERDARIREQRDQLGPDGHELIRREAGSGTRLRHRYRHVVVDEAQDLHPAHWKMLRAMVAPGPNDMFIVGDPHQRIYDNYVSLGSLGINIRGRSTKLTLSYRTTRQNLAFALGLLSGEQYDDLDGGEETLAGYRSVLHGMRPHLHGAATWGEEQDAVVEQVRAWNDVSLSSIAICVPTREMVTDLMTRLEGAGFHPVEIGPDGPKGSDGVHVGTMHRFKGLEYQRMILAGVSDGLVPRRSIEALREADPVRYRRERQRDRSLLFVAATRARDALAVFWHGTPSPFLTTS
ncbi:UvrD-helicase domain-containing protein [Carbonactinospora thermoautotrophica]|nr:UvrD-helicase domain-containing protein [Carbonactinospora thermoautotrophica]